MEEPSSIAHSDTPQLEVTEDVPDDNESIQKQKPKKTTKPEKIMKENLMKMELYKLIH